jgi:hypothetical protein
MTWKAVHGRACDQDRIDAAQDHQILGVPDKGPHISGRWTELAPRVRLHEVQLDGIVACVDELRPGQIPSAEKVGPQGNPRRSVEQPESFPQQFRCAFRFPIKMGDARDAQITLEKRERVKQCMSWFAHAYIPLALTTSGARSVCNNLHPVKQLLRLRLVA